MSFLLRGDRKYIQGADIFLYIEKYLKNKKIKKINIIFKGFLNSHPNIKILNKKKNSQNINSNYSALCEILYKKKTLVILFNNSKKKLSLNYSYDENLFHKYFKTNKRSAKCNFETSFKDIEVLIALTKFWHEKHIDKNTKWIVNKIELNKALPNKINKKIIIKNIENKYNKYTVSNIIQNERKIGKIFFSSIND